MSFRELDTQNEVLVSNLSRLSGQLRLVYGNGDDITSDRMYPNSQLRFD